MNLLRLEELESRHLLSGGYFAPQHFGPSPFAASPGPAVVTERSPHGVFGGGPDTPGWDGMPTGPSWIVSLPPTDAGPTTQVEWMVIEIRIPGRQTPVTVTGSDPAGTVTGAAAAPRATGVDAGAIVTAVESAAARAATAPAARVTSQTPFLLVPTVNIPTLTAEPQGPIAAQIAARTIRTGDGLIGRAGGVNPLVLETQNQGAHAPRSPDSDGEPVTVAPPPTSPTLPGLLAALPAVDLAALGRGLEQFMDRLERSGEQFVGDSEGLRPWLVAAAAAATACEIARRQIQRTEDRGRRTARAFGTATCP